LLSSPLRPVLVGEIIKADLCVKYSIPEMDKIDRKCKIYYWFMLFFVEKILKTTEMESPSAPPPSPSCLKLKGVVIFGDKIRGPCFLLTKGVLIVWMKLGVVIKMMTPRYIRGYREKMNHH